MSSKSSKQTILVLGDSLCLPRNRPEVVNSNETWSYLLKNAEKSELVQLGIGGGTIDRLYEQSKYYNSFQPDIVIIQSGIVDCAPRALGRVELEVINSIRILSFIFQRFLPTKLFRKYRKMTYTKPKEFRNYIKQISAQFTDAQVYWIGILPVSEDYKNTVPGIAKNVDIYNNIISSEIAEQNGVFISCNDMPMNGIMSDHHHLNTLGHQWLFKQISSRLSNHV